MKEEKYKGIQLHYESCFDSFGDTVQGVDWPNERDADIRYQVMVEVVRERDKPARLLDYGCGTGLLYSYLLRLGIGGIEYSGLDISEKFIAFSKEKYPGVPFYQRDALKTGLEDLPDFDYIIFNGVFTERLELTEEEMFNFLTRSISIAFQKAKRGIAFNVMSKAVDWERDDLYHLPADKIIAFMAKNLSRHFVLRNDYGLYEYTVYLYKEPSIQ